MEKGEAGKFKGKTLDEINLHLEDDLIEETVGDAEERDDVLAEETGATGEDNENENKSTDEQNVVNKTKKGQKRVLVPWTENQKKVVLDYFKTHIKANRPPKRGECDDLISKYSDLLKNKNWLKIKVFVQNQYKNKKK
ncbi:hypothetical protein MML48_4g00004244 [Holotrichia oblita]|uniref:Uncharacterized protein n=1 Tax=Holotrichia oblita TaxID=644536 RepID=A0ACB9T8P9_HOLOL|nr:hypothetical protein MML48_4g00004244 [Holotrichia oblita]